MSYPLMPTGASTISDPVTAAPPVPQPAQLPPAGNTAPAGNMGRLQDVLRTVIPLLAAAYAAKKGSLGSMMEGYQGAEKQKQDTLNQQQERAIQKAALDEKSKEARDKSTEKIHALVKGALDEAAKDPNFLDQVNQIGADKFHMTIPGVGNISLTDAAKFVGGVTGPDGKLHWGSGSGVDTTRAYDEPADPFNPDFIPSRVTESVKTGNEIGRRPLRPGPAVRMETAPGVFRMIPGDKVDEAVKHGAKRAPASTP